jgi:hypothetical protein
MLLLIAFLAFLGSWLSIWAAWPRANRLDPDLWTENPVHDYGLLYLGQQAQTQFEMVNHYSQPLRIVDVFKSCNCSEASFSSPELGPGQKGQLQVVWTTGRSRGSISIQTVVKYKLADGSLHSKSFTVAAEVVPDIHCKPDKLQFDGPRAETQIVRLSAGRMSQFTVKAAYCNHPAFKANLRGANAIEVAFDGVTPVYSNGLEPRLIIQTDSPNEPQLVLPVVMRESFAAQ